MGNKPATAYKRSVGRGKQTRRSPRAGAKAGRPPIVGIGASAGGIDAVTKLLRRLPASTGLSFVVIQHLAPRRPSQLSALLGRSTGMPVVEAKSGMRPEADHVYVIPPGVEMALRGQRLVVGAPARRRKTPSSIDLFLRSLAEEERGRAIGVLLSGTGSDGTEGLRAIRAEGGITLVEDPTTARFPAMPESAIAAGAADRVLSLDALAAELVELSRSSLLRDGDDRAEPGPLEGEADQLLAEIFALVRGASGVDFSEYKATSLRRRLSRRMLLRRVASIPAYLDLLRAEPAEVAALGRDVLVHVTEFFRDPDAFHLLASQVIPQIVARHRDGSPIRVWVPGCSTGEEAYSIAICLLEALGDDVDRIPIQVFATDLSPEMVERARAGAYPEAAVRGLGSERVHRFFNRTDAGASIGKAVRTKCVFVQHDLTRDPPFAHLDLISCRNVLIYFSAGLQRRVIPLFHHCLNPGGFLLLGHAEAIAGFKSLFSSVDKTHKLFARVGGSRSLVTPPLWERTTDDATAGARFAAPFPAADVQRQAESMILSRYAPPAALVDDQLDVVHLRGDTAPFLELGPGHPDLGLLKLARPALRPFLRAAIDRARKDMVAIRRDGVKLRQGDHVFQVAVEVIPVATSPDPHFLVLFEHHDGRQSRRTGRRPLTGQRAAQGELQRLRKEADATRDYLQSLIDERQRMHDEVTAANEELIASNEELQSTNEELESAKEELQSANEELTTVNDELQVRNQELDQLNGDLMNLLASVDLPIVIVSGDRRVRRFTPGAKALMNLIPGDIGRPLDDIKLNVAVDSLDDHISEVLATLQVKEIEVVDRARRWHRMQIRPYRTVDGKLDGAVISLTDIDLLKQAAGNATAALDQMSAILRTIRVPLVVLDERFAVRSANPAYYETYCGDPGATIGRVWFDTCDRAWDSPELRAALAGLVEAGGDAALDFVLDCPLGSTRTIALSASVLRWASEAPVILITSVDVTERTRLLERAEEARSQAVRASQAKDVFLATLSHELRGPLHTIALHADLLLAGGAAAADRALGAAQVIARSAEALERIISDLLDVSSIIAGKISLKRKPVDLQIVIGAAIDAVRDAATRKRIDVSFEADPGVAQVVGDETRLLQVVGNLVGNAIKFTPAGGQVVVELEEVDSVARIRVTDSGAGIASDFLPHVFDRFAQADSSNIRPHGGLGLGLAIVRDLVRLHGGSVRAESDGPGTGATFTVDLPRSGGRLARGGTDGGFEEDTDPSGQHLLAFGGPAARPHGELAGVRILMVDDDAAAREVVSEMLHFHGAEVRAVASAAAAMTALGEFLPDVLLCDVAMPIEDGYCLIRRIRALPADRGGQVPAVAVTALATRDDRKRALAAGFQLHVVKPAPIAVLCEAVQRARAEPVRAIRAVD